MRCHTDTRTARPVPFSWNFGVELTFRDWAPGNSLSCVGVTNYEVWDFDPRFARVSGGEILRFFNRL